MAKRPIRKRGPAWKRGPSQTKLTPPSEPPVQDIPADKTSSDEVRAARLGRNGAIIAASILAVSTVVASVVALKKDGSMLSSPPLIPPTVMARIVNTGGVGVFYYSEPNIKSPRSRGPIEGDVVAVICQERNGEPLTDKNATPDQPSNWPVWNKVPDGRWFPDLWSDLPKSPGSTPPRGLPTC